MEVNDPPNGEEEYLEGDRLFQSGQYLKSIPYFEKSAAQGYPASFIRLGRIYKLGDMVVRQNTRKSVAYFKQLQGKKPWFEEQARKQTGDTYFNLALCYVYEELGPPDDVKAVLYYGLAAEKNHGHAQFNLALAYSIGKGVLQDDEKAVKYYKLAAEQNLDKAMFNLGVCYANGRGGLPQDQVIAGQYYKLAADKGFEQAQFYVGMRYVEGRGFPEDKELGKKYLQSAADQGLPKALIHLAGLYENEDKRLCLKYGQLAHDRGGFRFYSGAGYVVGSRSACEDVLEQFIFVLMNRNQELGLLPELWILVVEQILKWQISNLSSEFVGAQSVLII